MDSPQSDNAERTSRNHHGDLGFVGTLRRFNSTLGRVVDGVEHFLLIACVAGLALLLVANVVARTFFQSLYFAEEISQILVIVISFVGISYAARKARHIRMGAILEAMPKRVEKVLIIFISLISAVVLALMAWYSVKYFQNAYRMGQTTAALRMPKWWIYAIIPVGFSLASLQYVRTIIKNFIEADVWQSPDQRSEYEEENIEGIE